MSTTEAISLVAMILVTGGAASWIIEQVKRASWGSRPKWLTSVAISALVGLATSWLAGDVLGLMAHWGELSAAEVFAWLSATYAAATGFYELYAKPKALSEPKALSG